LNDITADAIEKVGTLIDLLDICGSETVDRLILMAKSVDLWNFINFLKPNFITKL
jgi:hypothetical protein